jgi:hypothetical protein
MHTAHTEVQLLVGQILMNFAVCDESRPFLLDHGGLVDVMVEAVGMNQLREAVRTSALKALLELGRADNRIILNRVRLKFNYQFSDSPSIGINFTPLPWMLTCTIRIFML